MPFQVNRGHGNPKMPEWAIQGSLKTWTWTPVPTCQRECGCCKTHRRHFSPPSGPAGFPGSSMQSTGCSHSNKRTPGVKVHQQLDPCKPESLLARAQGPMDSPSGCGCRHVVTGWGQLAGIKVIRELENIESRVLIILPPLCFFYVF